MTLVYITGASRGIGRATALELAKRGCRLALLGRVSTERDESEPWPAEIQAALRSYECDLREPRAIALACERALAELGPPDAVIANAGVVHRTSVQNTTLEQYDEQLAVNLRAPFLIVKALLPAMLARKSGRFVFVGSISATLGSREAAAYAASKWGLVGFMKSLAEELSDTGLSSVAVLPGSVNTAMLTGSGFAPRMTAEDVARTLVHYALDAPLAHNGGVVEMFGV